MPPEGWDEGITEDMRKGAALLPMMEWQVRGATLHISDRIPPPEPIIPSDFSVDGCHMDGSRYGANDRTPSMTLTQLRSFIAVVQHGGFTAAARAMHSSQTTVTSQIQALEEEHGVELFHRRGRRVDLTATGSEFLRIARQIVDLEDDGRVLLEDSGSMR